MPVELIVSIGGLVIGALASYYGSMIATARVLGKMEAEIQALRESARESRDRADLAHERLDRFLQLRRADTRP